MTFVGFFSQCLRHLSSLHPSPWRNWVDFPSTLSLELQLKKATMSRDCRDRGKWAAGKFIPTTNSVCKSGNRFDLLHQLSFWYRLFIISKLQKIREYCNIYILSWYSNMKSGDGLALLQLSLAISLILVPSPHLTAYVMQVLPSDWWYQIWDWPCPKWQQMLFRWSHPFYACVEGVGTKLEVGMAWECLPHEYENRWTSPMLASGAQLL